MSLNAYAELEIPRDSTLTGAGFSVGVDQVKIDNCHFIGCGTTTEVIGLLKSFEVSVTHCTVTSLVNNILYPGGDVAGDSCKGLLASTDAYPGLYVGDCITSDIYNPNYHTGDGEQISMEALATDGAKIVVSAIIYQNTLSGDGFETLQNGQDTIGVSINVGENIVVADNDISNVQRGIEFWGAGGRLTYQMPFDITSGNSIHNVLCGIYLVPTGPVADAGPWFVGNTFSHNLISGGQTGSEGIEIEPFFNTSNGSPQLLMNVFYENIVASVSTGMDLSILQGLEPNQVEDCVVFEGFFSSDGSVGSQLESYDTSNPPNPCTFLDQAWQGFWN